jgi:hypothetical protein
MSHYPQPWRITVTRHDGSRYVKWTHGRDARKDARGTYRELADSDRMKRVRLDKLTARGWERVRP